MNPDLKLLQPYPFQKLSKLLANCSPSSDLAEIRLSIGEPMHSIPDFVEEILTANINSLANYPLTKGSEQLRQSIAAWLMQRYSLSATGIDTGIDISKHILPVNGTREALFAFAQTVVDNSSNKSTKKPLVMMPNPFYQIYEGAALLAGAEPYFMNCTEPNGFLPDLDSVSNSDWENCQLIYICSPANPTGAVLSLEQMKNLISLAHKYDFIIAADECYSEIYHDENNPPPGLLEASNSMGNTGFSRCVVFHSLSKRSNLPGLRSGFVAGDSSLIDAFHLYRTYHGCAMSPLVQQVSSAVWADETHVRNNRQYYREKFIAVEKILSPKMEVHIPDASFYLWLATTEDDEAFTKRLFQEQNVVVLPGSYLSRSSAGINPGKGYVRIALVAEKNLCIDSANRIADTVQSAR